jgi:hypothetical protein
MTNILGVEINLSKSLISDKSVMEFAKRLVAKDEEYTPLGANLLLQVARSMRDFMPLFVDSMNKGLHWSSVAVRSLFSGNRQEWLDRNHWRVIGPFGITPSESSLLPRLELCKSLEYSDLVTFITDCWVALEHYYAEKIPRTLEKLEALESRLSETEVPWELAYLELLRGEIRRLQHKYEFGGYQDVMEHYDPDDLDEAFGIDTDD